jgi:Type IX secretion system protein PorV
MMKKLSQYVVLVYLGGVSLNAFSQGSNPGIVIGQDPLNKNITTAVPFLTITPDSRAAGMGDTGVATSPDVNSSYWNAGKLAFVDKGYGVSLSYTPWLAKIINDMKIAYLSGFYKIDREQTVGMSIKYFDLGKIDFRDNQGGFLSTGNPREFAIDATYSRLLTEHFSVGVSLRYINSNLTGSANLGSGVDAQVGQSVAVDLGVFYTKPLESKNATLSWGASISNIGAKMTYVGPTSANFIPTNLRLGGAYKTELNGQNSLTFALDLNKLMVPSPAPGSTQKTLLSGIFGSFGDAQGGFSEELAEITISSGIEYWYNETFSGRLGYFYEAPDKGNRKYLTAGIGFKKDKFGFDGAYMIPTNGRESALAETFRITINYIWPTRAKEEESVTNPQ